jgi:hypothetical protein
VEHKTGVLTVLEAEIPDEWVAVLPSFISTAQELLETAVKQRGEASSSPGGADPRQGLR